MTLTTVYIYIYIYIYTYEYILAYTLLNNICIIINNMLSVYFKSYI